MDPNRLKARYGLLAVIALAALSVLCVAAYRSSEEHSYANRPLAFWCDHLPFTDQMGPGGGFTRLNEYPTNAAEQQKLRGSEIKALAAIDALGTNCLAELIYRLRAPGLPLQFESRKLAAKLGLIPVNRVNTWHMRRTRALTGIVELGDKGRNLVPDLTSLKTNSDAWLSAAASYALSRIEAATPEMQHNDRELGQ
jgi:hypothetical protein